MQTEIILNHHIERIQKFQNSSFSAGSYYFLMKGDIKIPQTESIVLDKTTSGAMIIEKNRMLKKKRHDRMLFFRGAKIAHMSLNSSYRILDSARIHITCLFYLIIPSFFGYHN